jgi:uncharacterized protein (DUF2126 family)
MIDGRHTATGGGNKWEVSGVAYPLYYRKYVAAGDINEAALMAKYRRTKKK